MSSTNAQELTISLYGGFGHEMHVLNNHKINQTNRIASITTPFINATGTPG